MIPSITLEVELLALVIFTSYMYLPALIFDVVAAFIVSATFPFAALAMVTVRFAVVFAE
jgi:hypothetical protein